MVAALKKLRILAPLVATCVVLATLLLCVLCAKTGGKYVGGLAWPYVSDLARDSPAYYLFGLGALATAMLLTMNWAFNYQFQYAVLMESVDPADVDVAIPRAAHRLLLVCLAAGVLSMLGLVFVGMFSAASYPVAHSFGAHWFFLLESIAVFLNTFISYKIQKFARSMTDPMSYTINGVNLAPPSPETLRLLKLQRTFHIQFVVATAFFIASLLYLPVGLAVVQDFKRLSINECLERELGEVYCTQTMRYNAMDTKLWDYEDDFAANQMRAIAQLGCILTLLGYSLSFASHDYEEEVERCASRGIAQSTHFYNLAVLLTPPAAST
jgi:hypothetical membrane protein